MQGFQIAVAAVHEVTKAVHPGSPLAHFTIRHGRQIRPKRPAKSAHDFFRGVQGNAAY